MKFLIIGLGNVGEKYELTRHNIGFLLLDNFSYKFKKKFLTERYGQYTRLKIKGRNIHLLKPNTLMNLSGKAVSYWMNKLKIKKENLLILVDDLNLPYGKKRINSQLRKYKGMYIIIKVPVISRFVFGRKVGYKIERVKLSKKLENISATNIRKKFK